MSLLAETPESYLAMLFLRFGTEEDTIVREAFAGNPRTPPAALAILAGDRNEDVRAQVVLNPNCPESVRLRLAGDDELTEAWCELVEQGVTLGPDVLDELASYGEEDVLVAIAGSEAAPPAVLLGIAQETDSEYVVEQLVANPNTTEEVLLELGRRELRLDLLLDHPKTPTEVLQWVVDATRRYEGSADMWFTGEIESILEHPNAPRSLLEEALDNDVDDAAFTIAANEGAPEDLRRRARAMIDGDPEELDTDDSEPPPAQTPLF